MRNNERTTPYRGVTKQRHPGEYMTASRDAYSDATSDNEVGPSGSRPRNDGAMGGDSRTWTGSCDARRAWSSESPPNGHWISQVIKFTASKECSVFRQRIARSSQVLGQVKSEGRLDAARYGDH